MKLPLIAALTAGLMATSAMAANNQTQAGSTASSAGQVQLSSEADRLSYTIGADLGRNFKKQAISINIQALIQGVQDSQSGQKLLLTKDQMEDTLKAFQKRLMTKRVEKFKQAADSNKEKGVSFLATNKQKKGVVTLPSGLQYRVITTGKGAKPSSTDTVKVEYTGKLIDGRVFDSTEKAGKPATFKVNEVIPGWTEALQLMQEGSTWEIVVPSDLAYGPRGVGEPIGPNETLIFQIHLLSVEKANNASSAGQKKSSSHSS